MKKVFLKSLLLLCALIVGSSSAWGDPVQIFSWTARTSSSGSDTYTSGYTEALNGQSGKDGYLQDSGTKDKTICSISLYYKYLFIIFYIYLTK